MVDLIAAPFGQQLPYLSLFNVPKKASTHRRAPHHFWQKAVSPIPPIYSDAEAFNADIPNLPLDLDNWLDIDASPISDTEDETSSPALQIRQPLKKKSFARIRQIAFRAFVPSPGSHKPSTIISTEIVSRHKLVEGDQISKSNRTPTSTIFNSLRIKSRGAKTEVKKLVAVVRKRISSRSPDHEKPKTWQEYHRFYASNAIEINDPPLPPTYSDDDLPTPFHNRLYIPPRAADDPTRQLVLNRLEVFGHGHFDPSEEALGRAKQRAELADQLQRDGTAPQTVDQAWEDRSSQTHPGESEMGLDEARTMMLGIQEGHLTPETLEQHPVFRKIVKQCREMFNTSISMLSVMDDDRQIFLAESGLDNLRDAPRDVTLCAHTVLSGRKGFTVLDTQKDWRFENGPLVQAYGARFYAGVPLMAPNLDGSPESEDAGCPIGTLCVVDVHPRESFGVAERKKLIYMAEYARREIEIWFMKKMEHKLKILEASQQTWIDQVNQVGSIEGDAQEHLTIDGHGPSPGQGPVPEKKVKPKSSLRSSLRSKTPLSIVSVSDAESAFVRAPAMSLFDDPSSVIKPKMQRVFDLATKLVGETLNLTLVYLIAIVPHDETSSSGRTMVLSGFNLPLPLPSFDAALHLRALRAPEGGLLYQNTNPQVLAGDGKVDAGAEPYASALLVRVGEELLSASTGGFVLAGFTSDSKRVFGGEDVAYMKQFATQLARYTDKIKL